ncbi:hypothetical protein CQW23_28742 [Capsicum baccatum]|uniref:Squalene monooxygenase n=1 Tax=Capsicum baccatum TaxID=33114 RepID=A0A2G2VHD9_CAPBA|nr:hypothetical protein CQW23_28742 [Capsicum baccatum]
MMDHQSSIAFILAVIFGFGAIRLLFMNRKRIKSEGTATTATIVDDGECRLKDVDADVIIVGAGVAGAALAHTLGKVPSFVLAHPYTFLTK